MLVYALVKEKRYNSATLVRLIGRAIANDW